MKVDVDDVHLWRSVGGSRDRLDALLIGAVRYDRDCGVFLYSDEFDLRYPVVWPAGTDIEQADPLIIRLPDGATVEDGQIVLGGGGYHPNLVLFPDGCADSGETAVFNATGDVEVGEASEGPEPVGTDGPSAE